MTLDFAQCFSCHHVPNENQPVLRLANDFGTIGEEADSQHRSFVIIEHEEFYTPSCER